MLGVLAHNEAGRRLLPAPQQCAGAEMAIGDPHLSRPGRPQYRKGQRAFALMRVLPRDQIGHQAAVGIVNHDRLPRQSRPTMPAQHRQALFTARQVVAVEHAKLITRQRRVETDSRHDRGQPLGRTLHQGPQNARLGVIDLVIQRGQRHRQIAPLPCRGMQRGTQPQRHQRHQLHHRGEHQLARILALAFSLEHCIHPIRGKRVLQGRPCHHAGRRVLLKLSQNNRPHGTSPC